MRIYARYLPGLFAAGLLTTAVALAGGTHEGGHGQQNQDNHAVKRQAHGAGHGAMMDDHAGGHRHDSWVGVPAAYAGKTATVWDDTAAISRGSGIYQANCQACHGQLGEGDGPVGAALAHPPADLTNHFHMHPGMGDDYLFWRVSEGGTVEPFVSQQSAMPAFKAVLNEQQRWDVLAYIHDAFHGDFRMAMKDDAHQH